MCYLISVPLACRYCTDHGIDINTIIPETHVFRWGKLNRAELQAFVDSHKRETDRGVMSNVWILKPSGGGKGKDIEVVSVLLLLCIAAGAERYPRLRSCGN